MITNLHKNCMGTVDFDGQFKGMLKPQDFCVYPMHQGEPTSHAKIQSKNRIGYICLMTGAVTLTPPINGGARNHHLGLTKRIDTLTTEDLFALKAHIFASASGKAGTNGYIYTDNSGALEIFGATA